MPMEDSDLLPTLLKKVDVTGKPAEQRGVFVSMLISWLPCYSWGYGSLSYDNKPVVVVVQCLWA